jgi:hypothetical protein
MEHEVGITHLRDMLGVSAGHVAQSDEPLIVRRYRRADVVLVPLWERRWLKQIEQAIRAGEIDAESWLAQRPKLSGTWLDDVPRSR